jgi:stage V sporulation protein R
MDPVLEQYVAGLETLARKQGLDYYNVDFELVPDTFMMEIAVYGLPVRMPHWSFGVRYIYQLVQHRMGHSRLFEVVFPGDPNRAYLANRNTVEENTLVCAHVLGHSDFAKNNLLFQKSQKQVGHRIVEQAAAHARHIADAIEEHGEAKVEAILDSALALEQHIDVHKGLVRPRKDRPKPEESVSVPDEFRTRFSRLPDSDDTVPEDDEVPDSARNIDEERDLLWFIANYAPDMEDWQRDIFLSVREESFYFYPVFACQIMNEGWACYWHARLLRDADFLPQHVYLEAIKSHSDVVRPYAGDNQVALKLNPYHLGFVMWERIVERDGLDEARRIMREDDDFSFIRNQLDEDFAAELGLFEYLAKANGEITVQETSIDALREHILAPKFNFGAPAISVSAIDLDGSLHLHHDHARDGRGLDLMRAENVLKYIERVWHRDVSIKTVDDKGKEKIVKIDASKVH